jgi:glycosyltransferase involved in cell wall biosynthesis
MKWGAKSLNPFLRQIDITLEKENDAVICNSNFTKEQYEKIYKKKAETVIYPPCSIRKIRLEKNKENYILTVGRLSKFKKLDELIKVFKIVSDHLPSSKLIIVGNGEEKEGLKQLSSQLKLQNRISFTGKVNEEQLAQLYQKARVTVICSHNEPFGLVPVESMMHATPVIAHNSGGPRETIHHGITGFLFNEHTELAQLIIQVFEMNSDKYFQMQQKCLQEVGKYDVSNSIAQLESVFQGLNNTLREIN